MVHACNTGKTTRQRRNGEGVWGKAAEFDLADQSQVAEMLYPDRSRPGRDWCRHCGSTTAHALPPTGLLSRRAQREKAARALDWRAGFGDDTATPGLRPQFFTELNSYTIRISSAPPICGVVHMADN